MLKIITQKKPANDPHGDFLYCENWVKSKFRYLSESQFSKLIRNKGFNPIPMNAFGASPCDILRNQTLFGSEGEKLIEGILYDDYYAQPDGSPRRSMAMIPGYWLTKGGDILDELLKGRSEYYQETILDAVQNRERILDAIEEEEPMNPLEVLFLGSGIQRDFHPSDGSSSLTPVAMDTEQGDVLIFFANTWHNR
ncbi:MAG: hypothetical protein CL840_15440 [Crocinitomicaceae bacterium]|nr:hypothetical protein [Crocinitomicaceae bacterium]|tara:strand:+ start:85110 stop:85694 length:585 start_codon:yes stop_codon:yes gene_type:complete